MKMQLLAFAGKCGGFASPRASSQSSDASAAMPSPPPKQIDLTGAAQEQDEDATLGFRGEVRWLRVAACLIAEQRRQRGDAEPAAEADRPDWCRPGTG